MPRIAWRSRRAPVGVFLLLLVVGLLTAGGAATAAPLRSAGELHLEATLTEKWGAINCPAAEPTTTVGCESWAGSGVVPGLGRASDRFTAHLSSAAAPTCKAAEANAYAGPSLYPQNFDADVLTVAGKGTIDFSYTDTTGKDSSGCDLPGAGGSLKLAFTVTGGTGKYVGASGSGTINQAPMAAACSTSSCHGTLAFTGTIAFPGLTPDLTAPVIAGARSKTVLAHKGMKRVRVFYTVTAKDAVDGAVAASCKPRSGSFFPLGRTKVSCSATDSSGNTAHARFTVVVKP
jgi:HYR domain